MILAALLPIFLAAFDIGEAFSSPEAWEESAVDFAVDRAKDGFKFASAKRDAVVCLRKGACTWHDIEVWEARIHYGAAGSGATRIELSLYNRGDDRTGDGLTEADLNIMRKKIGAALAPLKPGKVEKKELRTGGFRHIQRWTGGNPQAELTWGTTGGKSQGRSVEFVRLTLIRQQGEGERRKSAKKSGGGTQAKMKSIRANVRRNDTGDVWIGGVPMVDQGQKGYCAAAVAERVLRYYGNDIDEHEIAQMAGTTARGGTSISEMIETVKTVGSKCRLGFNEIVSMGGSLNDLEKEVDQYNRAAKAMKEKELTLGQFTTGNLIHVGEMRAAMKPKVLRRMRTKDARFKKFLSEVKKQVDAGIPVFWGVTLGCYPEPEIPQASGGHMRLIIGYNAKTQEILYTDTWGAGHELKRMPEDWAFTITHDAFLLRPL